MKTISKFCLLLLLLCIVKTAKADDEQDLYLIGLEDGAYTPLVISNLRSLSFTQTQEEASDGSSVYVNHMSANYQDGTSKVFDLSAYASMKFDTAPSAILDLNAEMPATNAIMFDGKQLIAQRAGVLKIYGIDGRQVSVNAVAVGERVGLLTLPSGMYIVQLAGTSAKILVK
ncbi:MAG: T9SS type A sorting domain-containing protein [Bacteroidaceae bacterium]|nr:T9SS type A sorting domain-containing protein [Bacteroidaceae bacterium]